jgi:hypothetical protein
MPEKRKFLRSTWASAIGIRQQIALISPIGASKVEIYVPSKNLETVNQRLQSRKIMIDRNFNPADFSADGPAIDKREEAIKRTANLLSFIKKPRNFRNAILEAYDDQFQQEAIALSLTLTGDAQRPSKTSAEPIQQIDDDAMDTGTPISSSINDTEHQY